MKEKSKITLNKKSYPLYVGGSAASQFRDWDGMGSSVVLEAQFISDAYEAADIIWSIEDTEIADFDYFGSAGEEEGKRRVRARRTGITAVSAQLPDGSCAECRITVIDNYTRLTVSGIELNTRQLQLQTGKSARLIPVLYPKDIYENGMLDDSLIWESGDESVATVTDGRVTAVGAGETDIVVRSRDVDRTAVCHVIAGEADTAPAHIVCDEVRELYVGEQLKLPGENALVWQSDNRYVAAVDEWGCVTAGSASLGQKVDETGMEVQEVLKEVKIYATRTQGGGVTVYPVRVKPAPSPLHRLSVWPAEMNIPSGESANVTAAANTPLPQCGAVRWESSREEVLSVIPVENTIYGTAQARIVARSPGEARVTAFIGDKKACCQVCVTQEAVKVNEVRMAAEMEIEIDQVYQFLPELTEHAANKKLHWIGSGFGAATLDREGNVQGYCPGECRIYAIADDSLSQDQRGMMKQLNGSRMLPAGDEKLEKLLAGAVYGECVLTVREGHPALRNLHAVEEAATDHSVLLLWNRASLLDTGEFDRYLISCGGESVGETGKLGLRVENLSPSTEYLFRVEAVDKAGTVLAHAKVSAATASRSPVLNVCDFGARGDGLGMDTFFIQKAIDACPAGGTVLLPENHIFVSGALFLKSDMTFQVDGILMGSPDPKDYPRVITKWEGWRKLEQAADQWENRPEKTCGVGPGQKLLHYPVFVNHCPHASLLNAGCYEEGENGVSGPYPLENLVICGKGQINANGFSLAYNEGPNGNTGKITPVEYPVKDATSRGSAIRIHNGRNIYVKDVQVAYAPGWTVHCIYCEHITFDGMEIVSQGDGDCGRGTDILNCVHIFNGDGIDPESCVHVNLFDILFTTGDDAVAIKSGRNREGSELDKPNAYIRVTDCISRWSLGGFGTGSETAAGSHDLLFQNLLIEDILISGIWIKTCAPRGGLTEHIQVRDVKASGCNSPVWVYNDYSSTSVHANPSLNLPVVRHLVFENVHGAANNELGFRLEGTCECKIQDVQLRGVSGGGREDRYLHCERVSVKH